MLSCLNFFLPFKQRLFCSYTHKGIFSFLIGYFDQLS